MRLSRAEDRLTGTGTEHSDWTVSNFWNWAYSCLANDPTKGEFAEWMVAKLLGIETPAGGRVEGRDYDLILDGVKIEVKAAAYWQAWKLRNDDGSWKAPSGKEIQPRSNIRFAGLYANKTLPVAPNSNARDFKSDVYVFCFQHEQNPVLWNALDLGQWEFYVLTADQLRGIRAKLLAGYKDSSEWKTFSLSLATLEKQTERLTAETFREHTHRIIQARAQGRNSR